MIKQQILIKRHYLLSDLIEEDQTKVAYYNAFLFSNFGIVVDKPELLTREMIDAIDNLYCLNVPASYFKNPQDMKYYTSEELFVEQVISYFLAYGAKDSHVEVFDKELPEYKQGTEITLRKFQIVNTVEADEILTSILADYCAYTRPWSMDELYEVDYLITEHYYNDFAIRCGDNAAALLDKDSSFAKYMYKKDLVVGDISSRMSALVKGTLFFALVFVHKKLLLKN